MSFKAPREPFRYSGITPKSMQMQKKAFVGGATNLGGNFSLSNVSYGQPRFYSPLYTPSTWQIPVKKSEVAQWNITKFSMLLQEDFTFKSIKDLVYKEEQESEELACACATIERDTFNISPKSIIKDTITGGIIFENVECPQIYSGNGYLRTPVHISQRKCVEKKIINIRASGYCNSIDVSEEHGVYILDNDKIKRVRADNVKVNDYILTPIPKLNYSKYEILDDEFCYQLGKNNYIENNKRSIFITNNFDKKKFTEEITYLNKNQIMHIIAGFLDNYGILKSDNTLVACHHSKDLLDQLFFLCLICGIKCDLLKLVNDEETIYYKIQLPSSEINKIKLHMRSNKVPRCLEFLGNSLNKFFFTDEEGNEFYAQPVEEIKEYLYTGEGYDLQIDPERSYVLGGFKVSNCRFFANNEPKIAAALDWYSQFPFSQGFENITDDIAIKAFYDDLARRLNLMDIIQQISYEYFTMGDVFIFSDIFCSTCKGSGIIPGSYNAKDKTYQVCEHKGGTFSGISILNPDWMQVISGGIFGQNIELIYLMPDNNLKNIVQRKEPAEIYNRIPEFLKVPILQGKPILLHPLCTSHLAYNRIGYQPYGRSIIMRLFRTLAYKDKLTQAQWVVADRHIVPVRVVKVGNAEIPASDQDISQINAQLLATANDPNLTLVTHHAFEMDFVGSTGKVLQLTKEYDMINQDILDGLMLNQALLNGEGPTYSNASIGIEALIQRLESFRSKIATWIEEKIYRPVAIMQGFQTKDELNNIVPAYPKIKFKELNLRDDTAKKNIMMQLAESKMISMQTLLTYLGLDYNVEIERKRMEQVVEQEYGLMQAGEEGGGGMGGLGGGLGGMGGGGGGGMGGLDLGGMGGGGGMEAPPPAPGGAPGGAEMSQPAPLQSQGQAFSRPRITKNRPEPKKLTKDEMQAMQPNRLMLNQPEYKLFTALRQGQQKGEIKYTLYPQYCPDNNHKYRVDFAFPQIKLAVEVDGNIFHQNPIQKKLDVERDSYLQQQGWWVYRFTEKEVNKDLENGVYPTIITLIKKRENQIKKASIEGQIVTTEEFI